MNKVFKEYAAIYDIIYKGKDYKKECDFLDKVFKKYSKSPVREVLDVACGTANHAVPLARMGYKVFAQDISKDMLDEAKKKCRGLDGRIIFLGRRPMQNFKHKKKFDAVIAMFSSIDYLVSRGDLVRALRNIRSSLKEGGIFTCDFWNKDCVRKSYSPFKKQIFGSNKERLTRISNTVLDRKSDIANIMYSCSYSKSGKKIAEINELHRMKYHKISNMQKIFKKCGFKILDCFPFMGIGRNITDKDWNISIVAARQAT